MKRRDAAAQSRRRFLLAMGAAAGVAVGVFPRTLSAQAPGGLRIGVIGSGRIGGTVGALWVKAGHQVMFSSLDLEHDKALAGRLGAGARAGTPKEAAAFGEVLFFSVPYSALPSLGRELALEMKGKVVLDSCNPIPGRDGEVAVEARAKGGSGIASAHLLPGTRLVRAFNSVSYTRLQSEAHRSGEKVAIPLAADDPAALKVATRLVQDAGFEPVVVGPLARAREFDPGTPVVGPALTAAELRRALGIKP